MSPCICAPLDGSMITRHAHEVLTSLCDEHAVVLIQLILVNYNSQCICFLFTSSYEAFVYIKTTHLWCVCSSNPTRGLRLLAVPRASLFHWGLGFTAPNAAGPLQKCIYTLPVTPVDHGPSPQVRHGQPREKYV